MALNFPASPTLNDYHVASGRRWQWNGTAWQRIPDPGAQGVQGADGAQGFQGAQGVDGAQGAIGAQGAQGAQGFQGANGAQGAVGAQGAQGAAGAQGAQGAQGFQGRQGAAGAQGAQGAVGAQGAQGAQGAAGAQGAQGAQGFQGRQGAVGAQGAQGAAGSATITNNADNRVITGGSGTNLNGEANLTFDGSTLIVTGDIDVTGTVKTSAVPGTNTNAGLPVLFQTSSGVIDGGSSLTFNPANDVLTVNGLDLSSSTVRASGNGPLLLTTDNNSSNIDFRVGFSSCISKGNLVPFTDNTYDLGNAALRWANIYSADLQLSNEGSTNDVDGTWGKYTIQEGENDLFLINRRTGKKYKFMLEEVN